MLVRLKTKEAMENTPNIERRLDARRLIYYDTNKNMFLYYLFHTELWGKTILLHSLRSRAHHNYRMSIDGGFIPDEVIEEFLD
jgi:hypothetical protein